MAVPRHARQTDWYCLKRARRVWVDYEIADSDGGSGADSDSMWWRHPFTFTDSIFADAATSFEHSVEGYATVRVGERS